MLRVVVHEKGGRTQRFNFEGDHFSVGREEDNDLVLDRVNVSKHHLRFRRHAAAVEVVDLGSTNGTYVNGRKVAEPRAVRRSDRIYVGDYILMLEGDDDAIAPLERAELLVTGADGRPSARAIAVPPHPASTEPLPPHIERMVGDGGDDSGLFTSARRMAAPGVQSSYLDRIANRVLQTVMVNLHALDPVLAQDIGESEREEAITLVDGLIAQMRQAGEIEEGVDVDTLRISIVRELVEYGPLGELMKDPQVQEIEIVGNAPIRVVRDGGTSGQLEVLDRRFSGDRALVLTAQRLARKWGFFSEGTQILEGKVEHGFTMYALLPPTQVRAAVVHLRRNRTDANNLNALCDEGVLSSDMAELLQAAIRGCRRILIVASGATNLDRFMGAVTGEIPEEFRVMTISDTGMLGTSRTGWVQVRRIGDVADGVALSDALGVVLRGGVDMLVSQRARHEDAATVMDAFAGATRGAIVSLWGIDSAHGLWRMAGLSTVASGAISALMTSLARSLDLLVRLSVGVGGEPMQVIEIIEPRVKEGGELEHLPIFRAHRSASGATEFKPTGAVPSFVRKLAEGGIAVPTRIFKAAAP
ncbi:MAG: Flp pilus assembly complex ATPase component TadA [Deltaproteobacteria bacterium]|nr:Flp pilus assembly complex ATPase component TadA [Deltaproteobacteria bacterium]MBP7291468.1 Flp pilus assembly complex ATPase component TadA [Nannocystaceae bacterium]